MDRLTMRPNICRMASTEYCLEHKDCYECEHGRNVFRKLCEYEDLAEQGRLVALPCKVGDHLYSVHDNRYVVEWIVNYFVSIGKDIAVYAKDSAYYGRWSGGDGAFVPEDFGKTVFLTREEAEKALEGQFCSYGSRREGETNDK